MVHGDLKGVRESIMFGYLAADSGNDQDNILVDSNRTARLADFGLASITAVGAKIPGFSFSQHRGEGTYAWMAPELMGTTTESVPKSKPADIYATGMVIYEVIPLPRIPFSCSHPSSAGDISRSPLSRA